MDHAGTPPAAQDSRPAPALPLTLTHPALAAPIVVPADDGAFTREELAQYYWSLHPRFTFLKLAPRNARLFDIGAAWGRLAFWRDWLSPVRRDIEMHGCDLHPARFGEQFAAFHVMSVDGARFPYPDNFFDAIMASHLIEHLRDQPMLAREIRRTLRPGGMAYLETPAEESLGFPPRVAFIAQGCPTTTINFADDDTHTAVVSRAALSELFRAEGFAVQSSGTIRAPYVEDALLTKAVVHRDQELGGYGLWSKLGFAHYAVFRKPAG